MERSITSIISNRRLPDTATSPNPLSRKRPNSNKKPSNFYLLNVTRLMHVFPSSDTEKKMPPRQSAGADHLNFRSSLPSPK